VSYSVGPALGRYLSAWALSRARLCEAHRLLVVAGGRVLLVDFGGPGATPRALPAGASGTPVPVQVTPFY